MYEIRIGKNIILRKAKMSDTENMLKNVWSDERVFSSMLFQPTFTLSDADERCQTSIKFQQDHYAYFIALKDTDEAIGLCAITEYEPNKYAECGICIGVNHQGKGYGKEVVALLLDLAFNELGADTFKYSYFIENTKSKNLAKSFGFEYLNSEDIVRPWDNAKKKIDNCILTKDKYEKKK